MSYELLLRSDGRLQAADNGKRLLAAIIDGFTLQGVLLVLGSVVPVLGSGLAAMAGGCLEDNVVSPGCSIGRKAMGLRLVQEGGAPVDHVLAIKRNVINTLIQWAGVFALGIPTSIDVYFILAGDGRRIADRICDTVVIIDPRPK